AAAQITAWAVVEAAVEDDGSASVGLNRAGIGSAVDDDRPAGRGDDGAGGVVCDRAREAEAAAVGDSERAVIRRDWIDRVEMRVSAIEADVGGGGGDRRGAEFDGRSGEDIVMSAG